MGLAQVLAGVFLFFSGLVIAFFASRLPYYSEFGPGPGLLPLWIGVAIALCSIAITVKAARGLKERDAPFFQQKTRQVAFVFVTLLATVLLIPVLGLAVDLALFIGFTMRVTGKHRIVLCILTAVVTAVAVRLIFGHFLDIPLPKGLLGF